MEQRPLRAIIPTNGRKETSLVAAPIPLTGLCHAAQEGEEHRSVVCPRCKGGKSSKTLMDRSTNVCFCMISSVGVCFNDRSWAQGGPGFQFLHMQRFIWFAKGRGKKNWIYSLVRSALWRQLRRLTALFFMLASPRSDSTKLQCCDQGENELTVPKVC